MGSPPPNNSSQARGMFINAPGEEASQAERDAFENNFRSYVAFMQAFRKAWKSVLGDARAAAPEAEVYADNGGQGEALDNIANPTEFVARRDKFEASIKAILVTALNEDKLTNPVVADPSLGGQKPSRG